MRAAGKLKQRTKAGPKVCDSQEEIQRRKAVQEELDDLVKGPRSKESLSDYVKQGRR